MDTTVQLGDFTVGAKPVITGSAVVGDVLTATASFSPAPDSMQYDWFLGGTFKRATSDSHYTVSPEDRGKVITVSVAAFKSGYNTGYSGFSDGTAPVMDPPALAVTQAPSIPSVAFVGSSLTTTEPVSSPPAASVSYQWRNIGGNLPGATGRSYTPVPEDIGTTIRVDAVLTRQGYAPTRTSSAWVFVESGYFDDVSAVSIEGAPAVGSILHATVSSTPSPDSVKYYWFADDVPLIEGPSVYTVTAGDLGRRISAYAVVARRGYHNASSITSEPVGPVHEAEVHVPVPDPQTRVVHVLTPTTIGGDPVAGALLTATPPVTDVAGIIEFQWYRSGQPVPGATGLTYQPSAGDVGQILTTVATIRRDGYETATSAANATTPIVRAVPRVRILAKAKNGRIKVTIAATAAGLPPLNARAQILVGKKIIKRFAVLRGQRTVWIPRTRGRFTVRLNETPVTSAISTSARAR